MKQALSRSASLFVVAMVAAVAVRADVASFEAEVANALQRFYTDVPVSQTLASRAVGMLVFPHVYKAGFGIGGAVGDGALQVDSQTVQYYRTTGVSLGFQIGAQARTEIILFMTQDALDRFRRSANWQAGVDGSITLINTGAAKSIDTDNIRDPIMGFIFDNRGLMVDASFKGAKYWKIDKQ